MWFDVFILTHVEACVPLEVLLCCGLTPHCGTCCRHFLWGKAPSLPCCCCGCYSVLSAVTVTVMPAAAAAAAAAADVTVTAMSAVAAVAASWHCTSLSTCSRSWTMQ
jgi:hypothetical protein